MVVLELTDPELEPELEPELVVEEELPDCDAREIVDVRLAGSEKVVVASETIQVSQC